MNRNVPSAEISGALTEKVEAELGEAVSPFPLRL